MAIPCRFVPALGHAVCKELWQFEVRNEEDSSHMRERIIIIGNGMASQALCEWLTGSDTRDRGCKFEIMVFGDESRPAYDRVHLTSFISEHKTAEELELRPRQWYAERGIELRTGERIDAIDRVQREVVSQTGQRFPFSRLVLATGSRPFVPPVDGVDLDGVHVYRTISDLEAIVEQSRSARTAAVIGGGLLGLEAARALRDLSLIPHVVEVAPSLMPRQLDRECGDVLKAKIERMGVDVHLQRRTVAIERHGDYLVVRFDSGDTLAVDMVVISAGIRPRDELARDAGLEIGPRGGIVVNDELRTSDASIYAIGECASHRGIVYGLIAPCLQMARCLAHRFVGESVPFVFGDRSAQLKLLGVDVVSFGVPLGEAPNAEMISYHSDSSCRKILVEDRRLVGALGVGAWPDVDRIRNAVSTQRRLRRVQIRSFDRQGMLWNDAAPQHVADWPPTAIVCSCKQICRSELTAACLQGCGTADELAAATGASTVCGTCRPLLAQLAGHAESTGSSVAGWRGLLAASVTAMLLLAVMSATGPIAFSESVVEPRYQLDFIWRNGFWKQVTGYTLLGITGLSLLLSLRKRIKWFRLGAFGTWRMAHGILGLTTLLGILLHTGFHLGSNLNLWLMMCFLSVNLLGALTGVVAAIESRGAGPAATSIRQWRPRLTWIHILLFWPLPILIAAHVFCVYYY